MKVLLCSRIACQWSSSNGTYGLGVAVVIVRLSDLVVDVCQVELIIRIVDNSVGMVIDGSRRHVDRTKDEGSE